MCFKMRMVAHISRQNASLGLICHLKCDLGRLVAQIAAHYSIQNADLTHLKAIISHMMGPQALL